MTIFQSEIDVIEQHDVHETGAEDYDTTIHGEKRSIVEPSVDISPEDGSSIHASTTGSVLIHSRARLIPPVVVLTGASFVNTISVQAVVIILPTIGRVYSIPEPRQQWIVSAYALGLACFLLFWSRLADVYGRKIVFLLGSLWVTVASIVTPFAPNEASLDVFRALQGLGAAATVPTALGIIGAICPPGNPKTYSVAAFSAGFPLGSVLGNIFGGFIGQYASWQWVFWVVAIVSALITIGGFVFIPHVPTAVDVTSKSAMVDWFGGALITLGLVMLTFALTQGNVVGWSKSYIVALIPLSVVLILLFIFWQYWQEYHTNRRPLMKMSLWLDFRFSMAQVIQLLFFSSFNNYIIFATLYYQELLHLSVLQTTLRFIPTGVVGTATSIAVAKLLSRVDGVYILVFGNASVALANLLFAVPIQPHETYWAYGFPAMCLSVFGADTVYPALALFTMQIAPQEDQAMAGGIVNVVGQIGRIIGLAIATAIQVAVGNDAKPTNSTVDQGLLDGIRAASYFDFVCGILPLIISIWCFKGVGKIARS